MPPRSKTRSWILRDKWLNFNIRKHLQTSPSRTVHCKRLFRAALRKSHNCNRCRTALESTKPRSKPNTRSKSRISDEKGNISLSASLSLLPDRPDLLSHLPRARTKQSNTTATFLHRTSSLNISTTGLTHHPTWCVLNRLARTRSKSQSWPAQPLWNLPFSNRRYKKKTKKRPLKCPRKMLAKTLEPDNLCHICLVGSIRISLAEKAHSHLKLENSLSRLQ